MSVQDQSFLAQRAAAEKALSGAPAIAPLFLVAGTRAMLRVATVRSGVKFEIRARFLRVGSDLVDEEYGVVEYVAAGALTPSLKSKDYEHKVFDFVGQTDAFLLDVALLRTDHLEAESLFEAGATWVELFYGHGGSSRVETDAQAEGGQFVVMGRLIAGYTESNQSLFWPGSQQETRQSGTQSSPRRLLLQSTANASSVPFWLMLAPHGLLALQLIGGGGFDGTVAFEGSLDGQNWVALRGTRTSDGAVALSSLSPVGEVWQFDVAGLLYFRVTVSGRTAGDITVYAVSHRV